MTYQRYEELGGTLAQAQFGASQRAAHAAVREIIGFNVIQDDEDLEAYERAVCAALEVDAEYGSSGGIGEGLSSVALGKFSASMAQASSGSSLYDIDMSRAIRRELSGSSLLYQGMQ